MKWFRDRRVRLAATGFGALLVAVVCLGAFQPLPSGYSLLFLPGHASGNWLDNIPSGSAVEKAIYRLMELPGESILFRRAPRETVAALTEMQHSEKSAALYPLRALEEEQALDFPAAERDWKIWADSAEDRSAAHLDLANFYERRLQSHPELTALEYVGEAAPDPTERWTAAESQRSWKAFERALKVIDEYALPRSEANGIYAAWIHRYPNEKSPYARQFAFFLEGREFAAAEALLARYRVAFPDDHVFPVKAEADLAVHRGGPKDGLAVYDAKFEPLWPAELIQSYFGLVLSSHDEHSFTDTLRARIEVDPDDLKDTTRLFYLYQQQGQLDSAKAVLSGFRESKEARGAKWTATELETLEDLFEAIQDFPEAARYAYALASDRSAPGSERDGLVALTRILLTAPEQPLRVGAGNLALYRDIATMDRGPGYLNGILSLFLNTQGPSEEFATEEQLAIPYFHRARAAELLSQVDRRFPNDPDRPQLHARLMEAYGVYGENAAAIREGRYILAQFAHYPGRVHVALLLADAYERTHQIDQEFALYQDLLKELSAQAEGVPLGAQGSAYSKSVPSGTAPQAYGVPPPRPAASPSAVDSDASAATSVPLKAQFGARSPEYAQVLDRYLARLVSLHRLPDALTVLRGELDRNPQDPGLYERLADFLQQNALNSHEEEVFQRAIQQFQDVSWYGKLARFYLRQRRNADYAALMHKVTDIFSGTDLERFLEQAPAPNRSLALEVDLYAHQRFPHDLRFTERLITRYSTDRNNAALEKLLWEHWSESADLRDRLFGLLTRTGQLDSVLATLRQQAPEIDKSDWKGLAERNPAAERFWLEACLWQSHYEQGLDAADALAAAYPADSALGEQASSLYRSLAYFQPDDTDKAVAIQKNLLEANPGNLDTLARIGDTYADRERFKEASAYWIRMAEVRPGQANGYLQSATVFWDYFDFASAQAQLNQARARLNRPTLFSYEEGAIAESRGDVTDAIRAYTSGAAAESPSSESRERLLALARRPALRAYIEDATASLLRQSSPSRNAIQLRADILKAERRNDDLARELGDLIARTNSFDVLDAVSSTARTLDLSNVEQSALRREIALTNDPVRNLQLRYQLVDLLQQHDPSAAAQEVDAIYRDHSRILGVVRATVDYDWDHDRKQKAVSLLLDSAHASYPDLRRRFELEAARKLTDLGDYSRSRALLTSLLAEKPLESEYESAMANNLARANDPASLDTFYRAQLDLVRKAALNREEKQQRIGQLRRGVIAAATQLGNYDQGVDQYIELINAFPEDSALAQEAALYAVAHKKSDDLLTFYQKAIADSPRDPRWSIVLARLATAAENYPLAVDAYNKALRLRPERQDLYIAQASLDEHLYHFDDAIALYRKLYTLSYRDPHWMEKVAELSAREGRSNDAVKALETAWIDNRPAKASSDFAVADRLEKWNLLDEALTFAEQGVQIAGADLLVSEQSGAATYARILARKRQAAAAFARLASAREEAPKLSIAMVAHQVLQRGPAAVTDEEWRKQREDQRRRQATSGFSAALQAMSSVATEFYTPEERTQFADLLRAHAAGVPISELSSVYLPAAKSANLADLTSDFQWRIVLENQRNGSLNLEEWLQFQRRRVQAGAAGALLEKTAPSMSFKEREKMYADAASAYRSTGDTVGELRVMEHLYQARHMEGESLSRYYRLVLAQRPQDLIRIASVQDSAADYLVRHGSSTQALAGIAARSVGRPPVWRDAYMALAGLYAHVNSRDITDAFTTALDSGATIGDRVAHPLNRDRHLAGDVWFYYGSRYAEYLDGANDPQAEEFLPSELEHMPSNADAYLHLADYSAGTKRPDAALVDYQHSLDLRPDQPAVLDSIAVLQWNAGKQADAIARWQEAVQCLAKEMDARHVPESFWSDFQRVLGSISEHKQFDAVRQAVDGMLRIYVARNGNYRVEPLLEAGYGANENSIDWLLGITQAASNQSAVLSAILPNSWSDQGKWIKQDQLDRIYQRILEVDERNTQGNLSGVYDPTDSDRKNLVEALIRENKFDEARAQLAKVQQTRRNSAEWLPSVLQIAQADGTLQSLIASWNKQPDTAPSDSVLRQAASSLASAGRRAVLRFVYQRALDRRELTAPNFLGLAAIELDEHNTGAAVGLLKRLTLVSSDMYIDTDAAAHLLESRHLAAEALEFLRPLVDAQPWNASYKVRLAIAMLAAHSSDSQAITMLSSVGSDPKAPYRVRVAAAEELRGHAPLPAASEELQILAQSACPSSGAASRPYFLAARLRAAECATNSQTKEQLLRDALASAPGDDRTRLRFVFAAFAAHFDSLALLAADPYLQGYAYYGPSDLSSAVDEEDAGEFSGQTDHPRTLAELPRRRAIELIQLATAAYERRHDYAEASRVLNMGLAIVHQPADRNLLEQRQKRIEVELTRTQQNDARAPSIQAGVDQPKMVRPQIRPGDPLPVVPRPFFSEDQP